MARLKDSDQRLQDLLQKVEVEMSELKNEYELYFLQQIRKAPEDAVQKMKRRIREMIDMPTNNTQLKFKKNVLRARWGSLQDYWRRINLQIEKGTYRRHIEMADHRDKMRAALDARIKEREREAAGEMALPDPEPESLSLEPLQPKPRPKPKRKPLPAYDADSPELIRAYELARRKTGAASAVDARKLRLTLKKNAMAIKARTGCKKVEFRVAIEDGKPRFKAVPIK